MTTTKTIEDLTEDNYRLISALRWLLCEEFQSRSEAVAAEKFAQEVLEDCDPGHDTGH